VAEKLKIGSVPFLNAWPLVHGLAEQEDVALRLELPPALAPLLRTGEVDAALVPSIEYFRLAAEGLERARRAAAPGGLRGYVALPVAAIGSRGTIGSVKLFGYVDQDKLKRVLLDSSSRTSNAMARVIVTRTLGCRPHFVLPEEIAAGPARAPDAELVMGDRALSATRLEARWVLDLGQEWHRLTHKPFVYAMWVARASGPLARLVEILAAARDRGLPARKDLAVRAAKTLGISAEAARLYLTEQVHYTFGEKEQDGLRAFYRMVAEDGLAPEGVRLRVAHPSGTAPAAEPEDIPTSGPGDVAPGAPDDGDDESAE
jgi:chorismate dehydratase